ncbi:MAG TPA: porin [Rhodocyclaceae bacterium]|nr:porin [Rhodocyclaceae bacterium]HMZ84624.1 porin [Rhodocyclaceae bacterium]HNA04573.1 porin [Rhodocyclaceae bacterium]HNB78715.1 porin [Rhodocyclaceae bacterium]HNC60657.1 porin [Rhodocyclaceae bacterium]
MKRLCLLLLLMMLALPGVRAAGEAPDGDVPRDALGRGLDALWRESGQAAPPAGWDVVERRPIIEGDEFIGSTAALRGGELGAAVPALPPVRDSMSLVAGTGFRARVSTARASAGLYEQAPPSRWASAAAYESDSWRAFASVERAEGWSAPSATDQGLRVGAAYRRAGTQLSAGWETASHDALSGDAEQKAWWIGLAQRVGDGAFKLNFARALDASVGAMSLNGARQIALGYEHGLSAQTAIYAFYTRLSNDPNGVFRLGGGEVDGGPLGLGRSGISLGIRHSF